MSQSWGVLNARNLAHSSWPQADDGAENPDTKRNREPDSADKGGGGPIPPRRWEAIVTTFASIGYQSRPRLLPAPPAAAAAGRTEYTRCEG